MPRKIDKRQLELRGEGLGDLTLIRELQPHEYGAHTPAISFLLFEGILQAGIGDDPRLTEMLPNPRACKDCCSTRHLRSHAFHRRTPLLPSSSVDLQPPIWRCLVT
jgi:hypothetical protein